MDLEPFELLASVIELGSLSSAAARHGVSQPAVSARIRTLEKRVGLQLLVRRPTGSRPTVEGAVVAQAAARLLREAVDLAGAIHALRMQQRNVLRVAASPTDRTVPARRATRAVRQAIQRRMSICHNSIARLRSHRL
ncbi:MAG: LysR family transcriptional regulator [Acidimicrobiales bacterium]